ncbi:MAG: hypothetical protein ACI906_001640 [Candidatus Latescibacterota bacterium]|jgi:hypothetical protein
MVEDFAQITKRLKQQLMRSYIGQRFAAGYGRVLEPERWIFIIGCYNSGTTLLKDMLAEHPHIGVLAGEGVKFSDALPRPEDFGWQRMWCQCLQQVRLDAVDTPRATRIKKQWSILYPASPNLVEKSIANAVQLPFLEAQFSPAYFVYIVRNGYAVAEGIRRKTTPGQRGNPIYKDQYPIELCAKQWAESDRIVREDSEGVERLVRVTYEDFAENPAATLKQITDFIGIEPLRDELFGRQWMVHGVESTIRNMNEQSFARLSGEDVDKIYAVAGEQLAANGYERPRVGGNA